jgi:hypothetical protein
MVKKPENEAEVENRVRTLIKDKVINNSGKRFVLLDSKDVVDIIICDNADPGLFFIEIKHYAEANGRIGFGNSSGKGFQPEILKNLPAYFKDRLLWVFQKENDPDYYVLKSEDCLKHIAGDSIGEKQNNFKLDLFDKEKYRKDEDEFVQCLKDWLKVKNA